MKGCEAFRFCSNWHHVSTTARPHQSPTLPLRVGLTVTKSLSQLFVFVFVFFFLPAFCFCLKRLIYLPYILNPAPLTLYLFLFPVL